jgi:hypothetical protein
MIPLHAGHPGHESTLIVAFALVVVAAAFALTREGWSRVGSLVGVAVAAGGVRLGHEVVGGHGTVTHLVGHGIELSAVVVVALAGYYALFDALAATATDR